jgi:ribonuclease Z
VESKKWRLDLEALAARGVAAGPLWGKLQHGEDVTLDDGSTLLADEFRMAQVERGAIVIGGDNDTPALLEDAVQGAQLLVHEATYTEAILQKVGPGPTHSSVQRVAQFAAAQAVPNLILTHFSPRYDNREGMEELEAEARLHYSGQLFLASDFDSYELDAQGHLEKLPRLRKHHLGN